jgi:hypothetical protein
MRVLLRRFVREESGQDLIEYGLLVWVITPLRSRRLAIWTEGARLLRNAEDENALVTLEGRKTEWRVGILADHALDFEVSEDI